MLPIHLLKSGLAALTALSCFDFRGLVRLGPKHWGASLILYPWVGLLLGLLWSLAYGLFELSNSLRPATTHLLAGLLLLFWLLLSRLAHVQGAALVFVDYLFPSRAGLQQTDSAQGLSLSRGLGMGWFILWMGLKWLALVQLLLAGAWLWLLMAAWLSRAALLPWLGWCVPRNQAGFSTSDQPLVLAAQHAPRAAIGISLTGNFCLVIWLAGWLGLTLLVWLGLSLLGFWLARLQQPFKRIRKLPKSLLTNEPRKNLAGLALKPPPAGQEKYYADFVVEVLESQLLILGALWVLAG